MRAAALATALVMMLAAGCSLLFDGNDLHGKSSRDRDMATGERGDMSGGSDFGGSGSFDLGGVAPDMRHGSDGGVQLVCGAKRASITFNATTLTVGLHPAQLSAGDFNEDGALDVAVLLEGSPDDATPKPSKVAILVGNGHGAFTVKGPYPACTRGSAITSGKFSAAGLHRDVVVGCGDDTGSVGTNTLLLLAGNGDGSLAAPVGLLAQSGEIDSLAAADLDGNGEDDLIVSSFSSSAGGASYVAFQLAHSFSGITTLAGYSFNHWSTADVNGDRLPDPIATYGDNSVSIFRSTAQPATPTYSEIDYYADNDWLTNYANAVGDLDGDGVSDVVTAAVDESGSSDVGSVGALVYDRDTRDYPMSPASTSTSTGSLVDVALGDFDCDGALDAVAGSVLDKRLVILRGDGTGALHPLASTLAVNAPSAIVVGDFNGDHLPDLVVGARNVSGTGDTMSLTILLNSSQ